MYNLEGFRNFLARRRGRQATSPSSRALYVQVLKMLFNVAPALEVELLDRHFTNLLDQNRKGSYINRIIVVLHLWGKYANRPDLRAFEFYEEKQAIKSMMSDSEIEALLALPGNLKWIMFFSIGAFSGMRPGEVATLTTSSVDLGQGIFNADGKTGARPVPIAPTLLQPLTAYIKTLSGELLFPGNTGKPVSRQAWGQQFDKRIAALGIKRPGLSAHSLRHSFITRMLNEDINLFKVKRIVGHKRTSTTEQYVHFVTKDIVRTMKQDPLARKSLTRNERVIQGRRALEDLGFMVLESQEVENKIRFICIEE